MTTVPTITALPAAPSTSAPSTFAALADALLAALPTMVTEENLSIAAINTVGTEVTASAASAAASAVTATAAAASAVNAPGTTGSSATSLALTAGAKSFAMDAGKPLVAGQALSFASAADAANRMVIVLLTYDSGTGAATGTALAGQISGSGTYADWVIGMAALANIAGRHAIPVPAGAMTAQSTNPATGGVTELATNKVMLKTFDFDASTIEYTQFAVRMPKSWDRGTVSAVFEWCHGATTTDFKVSWGIQAVAVSDGDALDAAFGTAIYANDTGGTTNTAYASPETAAVTVGGSPASEDLVIFRFLRKADDATNDTLAVDARLLAVTIFINTSAENDA